MSYAVMIGVNIKDFYTFDMSDIIKYMCIGGQGHRHCGRQGQPGGGDQ